jgi:hypothetical protein
MTREQMDAAIALHSRWSFYSVLLSVLIMLAGFGLIIAGLFVVWGGAEIGTLLAVVGFCVCLVGLNKEPFLAR